MNKKTYLAFVPVLFLTALGSLNIYQKIVWKEPTDGVVWTEKAEGLTALKVEVNGPAYFHGVRKGDILYKVNDKLIKNKVDLTRSLWAAGTVDQKVTYEINSQGDLRHPSFFLGKKGTNLIYFYLALIGLTTLVISMVVFFNSKKQLSVPYVYFYLLSAAFYCFYTFSPTGKLDFLDIVFFWLDRIAFLAFPPLLLHYFVIFPQRNRFFKNKPSLIYSLYFPGLLLLLGNISFFLPLFKGLDDLTLLRFEEILEKAGLFHFAVFGLATWIIIIHSAARSQTILVKQQMKWIVYGLGFGVVPFSVLYVIPFLLGLVPSDISQLAVLLQALIPLTFAYSISRYKLMDFEVLLKKAATLIFSYVVLACVYLIVSSQTKLFSENKLLALTLGILAIILGATLFTPLKRLFQSLLDRVIYKKSYKYRKTLLTISQEIGRERNLQNLSDSLLELIANALSIDRIALLLPSQENSRTFRILGQKGEAGSAVQALSFDDTLYRHLTDRNYLSYYTFRDKRELPRSFEDFGALGFYHFLPLKVEGKIIGCLAMGKKSDQSYLNSDDWELLTTISSSVALALENAYLYDQASIRTREMQRLKDYSEDIIESLTVGVAVLDQQGRIIGWNRVLEDIFSLKKEVVFNRSLLEVLGPKTFSALFPSDTQQDFRLLSEISLELPQGKEKIFDIAQTPLLDNQMQPYGTIVVFEDITEKINLQHQLLTSEKLASIGLLSAGVAHEINTPLTGISSYVQMLQKKLTDAHYSQILEKIETQTDRVSRIIKNLLNFARNPSDAAFLRVDLKESLLEIVSLIDYKLKNMKIKLELKLSDVPLILAQGERLQQVFINIILNAIDAMPQGGALTVELSRTRQELLIKISDTGAGIKPEHLPHIFDPFFTTKGIGKGTGLGLSISHAIIKEHEGTIGVESEVGRGTCFTIVLPRDTSKAKKAESLPPSRS